MPSRYRTCGIVWAAIPLALTGLLEAQSPRQPDPRNSPSSASKPSGRPDPRSRLSPDTAICLARSADGFVFHETGQVLLPSGSSPSVVLLPNGALLVAFDYPQTLLQSRSSRSTADRRQTAMCVCRSTDDGRSWSRPRPIKLSGADLSTARHASLLPMTDGRLRLFFVTSDKGAATVRSATTSNGLDFQLDDSVAVALPGLRDPYACGAQIGNRVNLYVGELTSPATARRFESSDGRHFAECKPAATASAGCIGDVQAIGRFLRAYVTISTGIGSLLSENGRDWRPEAGHRIGNGYQPSVAQLHDGSFVMLYCIDLLDRYTRRRTLTRGRSTESLGQQQTADAQAADAAIPAGNASEGTAPLPQAKPAAADADSSAEVVVDADGSLPEGTFSNDASTSKWEPFANSNTTSNSADLASDKAPTTPTTSDTNAAGAAAAAGNSQPSDSSRSNGDSDASAPAGAAGQVMDGASSDAKDGDPRIGPDGKPIAPAQGDAAPADAPQKAQYDPSNPFPPLPDLTHPFDYLEWYKSRYEATVSDNAFDYYRQFMPNAADTSDTRRGWPELKSMLNSDYSGPPQPWDPAVHPEWEQTRQAAAGLMAQFQEATRHAGFARLVEFSPEELAKAPPGESPPMLMMLLPDLSGHRALVKQAISDAWRLEDGKVSAENMIEAFRTSLGSANHMHQGTTLIEHLVGSAEQTLVEQNARWALKQNVFDPEQIDTALGVLMQHDHDNADPAFWLTGEHAWAMDTVQYMFRPHTPGDPPKINPDLIKWLAGETAQKETTDRLLAMTPEDGRKSAETMDKYYREIADQFRTGYPTVHASALEATAEKYQHATPLTEVLLPALSRCYTLRTRTEASRRATQLSFVVHSFKAHTGRWPSSLDELPAEYGATMRTDPFTGGNFAYRVDKDGPVIYSLSENGRDDGGRHSPRWDDDKNAESDDYVFWPPQPQPQAKK